MRKNPLRQFGRQARRGLLLLGLGGAAFAAPAEGRLPVLQTAIPVLAGGQRLCLGHTASPELIDWNNDGRPDLLVGTFTEGAVYLFLNQGTAEAPAFGKGERIKAGGRDLKSGFG